MKEYAYSTIASGIVNIAYSLKVEDSKKDGPDDPFAFNEYDLWFDEDLNFFLDNMLDDIFAEYESDITSVWSTNESEWRSQ